MGEVLKKVGRVVFWALVAVGVFFAGRDLWRWAMPRQAEAVPVAAVESCACGSGQSCAGPRGGRYCLRPDGSKAY